jgi:membrane fusion protein, multidrug efflux system
MTEPTLSQEQISKRKKRISFTYWSIIGLLALSALCYWLFFWRHREYTDDAYVEGNLVVITPLQSGFVKSILTDDTYWVEKGQLLVELDETNAKIAFQKAKEQLAETVREVCQSFHSVFAYQAEIQSRKAEFIKAAQDYEHRLHVIEAGGVSIEDFEHAEAALRSTFFLLQMTEVLYEKALAFVRGTTLLNHPMVLAASDSARQAWVNLYRCKIYAPVEGLIAQRKIQVGMWTDSGYPMMAVIPLDQIWINANFKETQMKRMRIGQTVKITSDLYGRDTVFHGKIVGLPGGAGNAFSLLPPQNLSGNWIKIVQRLPVRVGLDPEELRLHPLRVGLSMEATVDLRDQEGLLVPESSAGSPHYKTPIFELEEQGDEKWIKDIILSNVDPTLSNYIEIPLETLTQKVYE